MAMNADRSQRRNALTNSITTTSAMNNADSVISVMAALIHLARRASTTELGVKLRLSGSDAADDRDRSSIARARSTMRASRLVNTLRVTPMAEMRKIGVSAI